MLVSYAIPEMWKYRKIGYEWLGKLSVIIKTKLSTPKLEFGPKFLKA